MCCNNIFLFYNSYNADYQHILRVFRPYQNHAIATNKEMILKENKTNDIIRNRRTTSCVSPFFLLCSSEPNSMKFPFLLRKNEGSSSLVRRKSEGLAKEERSKIRTALLLDFLQMENQEPNYGILPHHQEAEQCWIHPPDWQIV